MINKDQVEGRYEQAKGAVKATVGKVMNDTELQVKGKAQKAAGQVQAKYGDVKEGVSSPDPILGKDGKVVNGDQVEGRYEQAKGAVKATVGKLIGDTELQVKGEAQKAAGKVQAAYGDAKS